MRSNRELIYLYNNTGHTRVSGQRDRRYLRVKQWDAVKDEKTLSQKANIG